MMQLIICIPSLIILAILLTKNNFKKDLRKKNVGGSEILIVSSDFPLLYDFSQPCFLPVSRDTEKGLDRFFKEVHEKHYRNGSMENIDHDKGGRHSEYPETDELYEKSISGIASAPQNTYDKQGI